MAQRLVEAAPDGFIVTDAAGSIVSANPAALALFDYPLAELVGKSIDVLLPARLRVAHTRHRERYASAPQSRGMGSGLTLRGSRRDGSEFFIEVSLSSLSTPEGMQTLACVRDVSERVRAAEAL